MHWCLTEPISVKRPVCTQVQVFASHLPKSVNPAPAGPLSHLQDHRGDASETNLRHVTSFAPEGQAVSS